jgi:glycine/D-amino acid oxidase-like deaminating enzyme
MIDALIVGQGIAGTTLAQQFIQRGKKIFVLDDNPFSSSSSVAAGIINPITGRNFVKTWKFDELWSYLIPFYRNLENVLDAPLFYQCSIHRSLSNAKEYNDWTLRSEDSDINYLVNNTPNLNSFLGKIKLPTFCSAFPGARVDTSAMIKLYKAYLCSQDLIREEVFQFEDLKILNHHIEYKDIQAKVIVFAEGINARQNPLFQMLPFQPFKGQVIEIEFPNHNITDILKNKLFFVPLSKDRIWVGTQNTHNTSNPQIDPDVTQNLIQQCKELLVSNAWEWAESRAAIRPTVSDRRPILGKHPQFQNVFIFNGLGSKGTSLAPYFSNILFQHICNGIPLPPEVDILRFSTLFKEKNLFLS